MATGCPKCDGTGLIPLKKKDGSVVPYAWLFCECYEEEPGEAHELRPEDIDFPVSYSYFRSLCRYHGWPDPGSDMPPESDSNEVDQLKANICELEEKVNELTTRRFVTKRDTKYTIK